MLQSPIPDAEKPLDQLCLEASRETNPRRLRELVNEIDRKFDDQHARGKRQIGRALGYE
jgi:hypothetical protein